MERLADRLDAYVAVVTIPRPEQVPYVVVGDQENMASLTSELGSPRPEEWGPTHQPWPEGSDDRT